MNARLTDTKKAVFLFQIITRCYVKTALAVASRVNIPRMEGQTSRQSPLAVRSLQSWLCLLLAAISPVRHAEWFHLCSSTISSLNDRTMEMAVHINAFHLEVSYT
jgi:hypothetical protein